MLATRGDHVPSGTEWVHEVKWDGIRALVEVAHGAVRVWSRSGRDLSIAFPELAELTEVADDLFLDGEIVALGEGDVPSLGGLADRIHITDARKAQRLAQARPVTLLAFDVLRYDGRDLDRLPWSQRRAVLEEIGLDDVSWQVPATYDDGQSLLAAAEAQGLEGIVSKRVTGRYQWGRGAATGSSSRSARPGRSWSAATGTRPTASTGSVPCWSASRRRMAWSTADAWAAALPAGPAALSPTCSPRWCAPTTRSSTSPGSTRRARCGWSRWWWSTCSTSE